MPNSRQQAVAKALSTTTYPVGMCARFTRECFGVGALGDFDGDGDADAVDQWAAARIKNHDDRNPPAGVPMFWAGGSKGYGHAAVSLGGGRVRSTDRPTAGLVGDTTIEDIERSWRMTYLGWSEDLYGNEIPDPEGDLRRKREGKLAAARARQAKWTRWKQRNRKNIDRLKGLLK